MIVIKTNVNIRFHSISRLCIYKDKERRREGTNIKHKKKKDTEIMQINILKQFVLKGCLRRLSIHTANKTY